MLNLLSVVTLLQYGCDEPTNLDPADRLSIISGDNLTDTISATPVQTLSVRAWRGR
jgi:hypothetical protein